MKKKTSNKNVLILMLIILLIALAIGYATFSDILTISGTANAKGTFDLEFQNVEIVKNVGANADKTTAEISNDKNTLTVNVADLSYPGSGVEFSVDIVNVGTMPAEVQAVTPTKITGNSKIKVNGLDVIQTSHPQIEAGDRCNIHFTVEWPSDIGEIPENESSINFGLQIEYSQIIGENFEAKASHTDSDKEGNVIRTNIPKEGQLTEIITAEDYGKSINYVATVKETEVSNWKVLYNDKSNVYIILDDYLPIELIPSEADFSTSGTHNVYSNVDRDTLLKSLTTASYWSEFTSGVEGAIATGAPSFEVIMKSYNEKNGTALNTDVTKPGTMKIDNTDTLYVPHTIKYNKVSVYWLADAYPNMKDAIWSVDYGGAVNTCNCIRDDLYGIRPVVCLPTTLTGAVGETVEIDY